MKRNKRLTLLVILTSAVIVFGYGLLSLSIQMYNDYITKRNQIREEASKIETKVLLQQLARKQVEQDKARKEQEAKLEIDRVETIKFKLWQTTKDMVLERLKSPSTADFHDGLWEGKQGPHNVTVQGDVYTISGYVDSQNGFGAALRTDFSARLRLDDKGNPIELVQPLDFNHELEERATQAKGKAIQDEWDRKEIIWLNTINKVMDKLKFSNLYSPADRINFDDSILEGKRGRDYITLEDGVYTINGYVNITKDDENVREPGARYHYKFSRKVRLDDGCKTIEVEPLRIQ